MKTYKPFAIKKTLLALILPACILPALHAQVLVDVKEINTTGVSSSSYPFDFTIMDNKLFFIAADNSGTYGLWITTGTEASTQKISPATGPLNNIPDIVAYNNKLYFSYNDGINGYELWVSDGTAAGTVLFKDLYPGSTGSYPQNFTVANNKLFFMGSSTDGERRLYASDGTVSGTLIVKNNYIDLFNGYTDFAILNNDIYFTSDNGTGSGYGLWKSNGTLAGTVLVKPDFNPGVTGGNYAVLDNKLYFSGFDYTNGSELWVTDGTEAGTHIVINLSTDAVGILNSGAPQNLMVYNNKIYFSGRDDTHGSELFVTDGTAAGTQLVKDIVPGTNGSLPNKGILFNGLLYFTCSGSPDLWKTDGTEPGTQLVKSGLNYANIAAAWNGKLYMILSSGDNYAVWQSDGSTAGTLPIQLQNTVNPVSSLNNNFQCKEYNSALYLSASNNDITVGFELAKITVSLLPLHLISFTGVVQQDKDVLNWTTSDEINTDHFTIQQSFNGVAFSPVASVQAAGNNAGNSSYNYTQPSARNPGRFYRLQMVDIDGKFTYSPVIKLKRTVKAGITAIYNTANKQITIVNSDQINCNWNLISINGSLVKQGASADAVININAAGITPGTYIFSSRTLNETVSTRLIIF
jgi:trimeric autotransporter adhesin